MMAIKKPNKELTEKIMKYVETFAPRSFSMHEEETKTAVLSQARNIIKKVPVEFYMDSLGTFGGMAKNILALIHCQWTDFE